MAGIGRVLVTGGSGFVGTNLIDHLRQAGVETHSFDRVPPRRAEHRGLWIPVDILDRQRLTSETAGLAPEVVIHLAARTDLRERRDLGGYAANIDGVANLVDAVRTADSVKRLIVASTQLVCPPGYSPRDENDYRPTTRYGQSKVLTERIVRLADLPLAWTIVRPTSLWGPWFGPPFRDLFRRIAGGSYVHPSRVVAPKAWGFVGNIVFQLEQLLKAPVGKVHRRTLYLSDYEPVELGSFVDAVQRAFGAPSIRRVPPWLLKGAGLLGDAAPRLGWQDPPISSFRYQNIVRAETVEIGPIRDIAGPLPFSVDEGIDITVRWLRAAEGLWTGRSPDSGR